MNPISNQKGKHFPISQKPLLKPDKYLRTICKTFINLSNFQKYKKANHFFHGSSQQSHHIRYAKRTNDTTARTDIYLPTRNKNHQIWQSHCGRKLWMNCFHTLWFVRAFLLWLHFHPLNEGWKSGVLRFTDCCCCRSSKKRPVCLGLKPIPMQIKW